MSEYIVCVDDLEESYYRYTGIKPETVFGHRLREEIVRCRDCRAMRVKYGNTGIECWANGEPFTVEPNGFCAWAKRREK